MAKIKNNIKPNIKISAIDKDSLRRELYNNYQMVVDFSFEGSFVSCSKNNFNNYLLNQKNFIEKFRELIDDISKLSQKTVRE